MENRYRVLSPAGTVQDDIDANPVSHEQGNADSAVETGRLFVSVSNPVSDEDEVVLSLQLP
jgi:hypothetical protein